MGIPAGPWFIDSMLTFTVNTHDVATGAAVDADSAPTFRVYDGTFGTPLLTDSMSKLDDANTLGFYAAEFELSESNGFFNNGRYEIYVSITVDSVTYTESYNFRVVTDPVGLIFSLISSMEQVLAGTEETRTVVLQASSAGSTGNDESHIRINNSPGWADDDLNDLLIRISVDGVPHTRWITDFTSGLATLHEALPVAVEENDPYTIFVIRRDASGGGGGASAEDVWTYGTRTLTALDEDSTTIDIDTTVRAAVGLASANLDTALAGPLDANVKQVNDIPVGGAGTTLDPWGPA